MNLGHRSSLPPLSPSIPSLEPAKSPGEMCLGVRRAILHSNYLGSFGTPVFPPLLCRHAEFISPAISVSFYCWCLDLFKLIVWYNILIRMPVRRPRQETTLTSAVGNICLLSDLQGLNWSLFKPRHNPTLSKCVVQVIVLILTAPHLFLFVSMSLQMRSYLISTAQVCQLNEISGMLPAKEMCRCVY